MIHYLVISRSRCVLESFSPDELANPDLLVVALIPAIVVFRYLIMKLLFSFFLFR